MTHVCQWQNAYLFDNCFRKIIQNPNKIIAPHVKPGMQVMDIGCGMGIFSIAMAKKVGSEGKVFSIDLQKEMLNVLQKRATQKGLIERIVTHQCENDSLNIDQKVDFAIAVWMVHEVPDPLKLFSEVKENLNPEGKFIFIEPKIHITQKDFDNEIELAKQAGLNYSKKIDAGFLSQGALFEL